jgi:hypothetical protein
LAGSSRLGEIDRLRARQSSPAQKGETMKKQNLLIVLAALVNIINDTLQIIDFLNKHHIVK